MINTQSTVLVMSGRCLHIFHDMVSDLDWALNQGHRQTDVIMDFAKAFDKVPHRRLQTALLRDYSQVDRFMAIWGLSKSGVRWSSLRSSPCTIWCSLRICLGTCPFLDFFFFFYCLLSRSISDHYLRSCGNVTCSRPQRKAPRLRIESGTEVNHSTPAPVRSTFRQCHNQVILVLFFFSFFFYC